MKPRTDSRKFKTIQPARVVETHTCYSRWVRLLSPNCRNRFSRAASPLAIGHRQGCSALATWHPRLLTADLTPFEKFPINDYDVDDPGVDFDKWTLTVTGLCTKAGRIPRWPRIQAASPKVTQNTRACFVEGWDVIGNFGGVRLSDFLKTIGADPTARFVTVECADDYYESLDMATAMHPQSLLCHEMYGQRLTREHGAPLRLNIPTKIGYKQAKYAHGPESGPCT